MNSKSILKDGEHCTESSKPRYAILDDIRGITLFQMLLYHIVWDMVYIFRVDWRWFRTDLAYVWQQGICWTFIALSGFCWSLGGKKWVRGVTVFGAGLLVSVVTEIFTPDQRIRFGVLTFLGVSMLLMIPLDKICKKIPAVAGMVCSMLFFLLLKNINTGHLGIGGLKFGEFPKQWYRCGDLLTFLGFTDTRFYSADYFSILPWFFLFLTGYFLYRTAMQYGWMQKIAQCKSLGSLWNRMGRKSLIIYMLHQPLIYLVLSVLDFFHIV